MRRNHIVIGAVALAAIVIGAITILVDPGFMEESAVPLVAFGLVALAVAGLGGMLLARAPWGRWTLLGATVLAMTLVTGADTPLVWLTFGLGGLSLVLLLGPWISLWIRHHAAADSPGPIPIALMAAGTGAPLVVGLLALEGAEAAHWLVVGTTMVSSLIYGRGNRLGIWLLRLAVPVSGLVLVLADPQPGSWVVAVLAVAVGVLAFLPAARRTTVFITPPLPAPVARRDPAS